MKPIEKITSLALARYVIEKTPASEMMVLKRGQHVIGELPRSQFISVTLDDELLLLEDIEGNILSLPVDCNRPTIVVQPTEDNAYFVTLPLINGLSLRILIHTRIRYDNL